MYDTNCFHPPLVLYHYPTQSIKNTYDQSGIQNNSYFNDKLTFNGTAASIKNNLPSNSFDAESYNNSYCSRSYLYLDNKNGTLENQIGNKITYKTSTRKSSIDISSNIVGLYGLFIYDGTTEYGNILLTPAFSNEIIPNSMGGLTDGIFFGNVVSADGKYSYLLDKLSPRDNLIKIEIVNGIRKVIIPPSPNHDYTPRNYNYDFYTAFYYYYNQSTFIQNSDYDSQLYNLGANGFSNRNLDPTSLVAEISTQYNISKNYFDKSLNDVISIETIDVFQNDLEGNKGTIVGVLLSPNTGLYINGSFSPTTTEKTYRILYASGDYSYLIDSNTIQYFKQIIDHLTDERIVLLPKKSMIINSNPNTNTISNTIFESFALAPNPESSVYPSLLNSSSTQTTLTGSNNLTSSSIVGTASLVSLGNFAPSIITNNNIKPNSLSGEDIIFNYIALIKTTKNAQLQGYVKNSSVTTGFVFITLKKDYGAYKAGTVICAVHATKLLNKNSGYLPQNSSIISKVISCVQPNQSIISNSLDSTNSSNSQTQWDKLESVKLTTLSTTTSLELGFKV